jgi:hypothetical protein
MYDIIEPIIHKATVMDLRINIKNTGLSIGDTAELHLNEDGCVSVFATALRRGFFLRRRVLCRVGQLGPQASQMLTPALRRGERLRVRIVGLTPEHLAPEGKAEMHISVWGTIRHVDARTASSASTRALPAKPPAGL